MGMNFLRRDWNRHPKLGKKRKSKQVWRRPKGRDNKMREKRKGYPKVVSIGYEKEKDVKGKVNNKEPVTITTVSELESLAAEKSKIAVVGKVGKKRKMEIAKKAQEKEIELANLNPKKYLKKAEFENKKKKETKDKRTAKKKAKEEKASKKSQESSKTEKTQEESKSNTEETKGNNSQEKTQEKKTEKSQGESKQENKSTTEKGNK